MNSSLSWWPHFSGRLIASSIQANSSDGFTQMVVLWSTKTTLPHLPLNVASLVGDTMVLSPSIPSKKPRIPGIQWMNNKHLLKKMNGCLAYSWLKGSSDSSSLLKTSTSSTTASSSGLCWELAATFFQMFLLPHHLGKQVLFKDFPLSSSLGRFSHVHIYRQEIHP